MRTNMKMELLSDAIPGSGDSLAGVIDREISYDKYGFPYIPAKRIKGILRESAEDLQLSEDTIIELFGQSGNEQGAPLIIDNGLLPKLDELRSNLQAYNDKNNKKKIGQDDVLGFYSYTRAQTTIDQFGVAKDKSLRISRVLKRDLLFNFQVELPEKLYADFQRICKVTRSFGSSRNRGFGEIKLSLEERTFDASRTTNSSDLDGNSLGKIVLKLENSSQIIVSNKIGMNQVSDDYIGGNFVLGALAYKYLRQKSVDATFKQLFLSGEVSFGNLYPIKPKGKDGSDYYPTPFSIKRIKSSNNNRYPINYYLDLSNCDLNDPELSKVRMKGGFSGYISAENNKITVNREVESHHARPDNRAIAKAGKDIGEFYQFEVIQPNHHFKGEVRGPITALLEVKKLLDGDNTLRLGKSKTGQYAKCLYQPVKIEPIKDDSFIWREHEEIKFIAQSDILLYNEYGYPEPTISNLIDNLAVLIDVTKENLKLTQGFIKKSENGGFVGVWRLPKIQVPVISAGSVIILKNCGEAIELPAETLFIGDRVEEGYGRVVISDDFKQEDSIYFGIEEKEDIQSTSHCPEFKELRHYYVNEELKRHLSDMAIEKGGKRSNSSTVARLKNFITDSKNWAEFSSKLVLLDSKVQSGNLREFEKVLFIKQRNREIDQDGFSNEILNLSKYSSAFITKEESLDFKYYKYYVESILEQIKLNNRRR